MKTTKNVEQFEGYDRTVANCHINNWGKIYLDEYGHPMEVEDVVYMMEEEENQKPKAPLIGADGNIFNLLGIAGKVLKRNGKFDERKEMFDRVTSSDSYDEALSIIFEYVEPVDEAEYYGED